MKNLRVVVACAFCLTILAASASAQMGMGMRSSTPEEMTARMTADIAKYGAIVDEAGIPKHD